jgi:hypothetical protein
MRILLPIVLALFLFSSCGSLKKTERALNSGDYDNAITIALKKLQTNKDKKRKQKYIVMLEDAYKKAIARDHERISFLRLDGNPSNKGEIYETYMRLNDRQEAVKPLLPLRLLEQERDAVFKFESYSSQIVTVKDEYSDYLYSKSEYLVANATSKQDYREAYQELNFLDKINPNYRNTNRLIQDAYQNGVDYVLVNMQNNTQMVIPKRLESDLLNFGTYGLSDVWVVYHNKQMSGQKYDYELVVDFRDIKISPEQIKEKEFVKEKQVKDGFEYKLDENDDQVRDAEGNKIKIDKFKTATFQYNEFTQFKSVEVIGNATYRNVQTGQLLKSFPLKSEFIFSHIYASGRGDKRALSSELSNYLTARLVVFPSNEQMVYDSGEDLKNQLKGILTSYRFQ